MKIFLLIAFASLGLASVLPDSGGNVRISKDKVMRRMRRFITENAALSCDLCTMVVDGINLMIQQNKTDVEIGNFLTNLCDAINLEQPHVCKHIVQAYTYEVVFVLEKTLFTPNEFCGAFIKDCGQSVFPFHVMWNISIPDNKPPVKPWPTVPDNKPTYRFLHLSDIHIDRQYAVGSEAYCQLDDALGTYALCCRNYADDASDSRTKTKPIYVPAEPWGMPYACDLPHQTFEAALININKTHKDVSTYFVFLDIH
ncbi:Saposin-like type B, region 1 [Cooperia oncophora]